MEIPKSWRVPTTIALVTLGSYLASCGTNGVGATSKPVTGPYAIEMERANKDGVQKKFKAAGVGHNYNFEEFANSELGSGSELQATGIDSYEGVAAILDKLGLPIQKYKDMGLTVEQLVKEINTGTIKTAFNNKRAEFELKVRKYKSEIEKLKTDGKASAETIRNYESQIKDTERQNKGLQDSVDTLLEAKASESEE